jgi:hypothetical protein
MDIQTKGGFMKKAIQAEIIWCRKSKGTSGKGKDFEAGFIKGLKQALMIINAYKTLGDSPQYWGEKE